MNGDYWLGLVTLPALALSAAIVYALGRVALWATAWATGAIIGMGSDTPVVKRRAIAATVFGAKRALVLTVSDLGVVFIKGIDHDEMRDALDRLTPTASLADWLQRDDATPATPPEGASL